MESQVKFLVLLLALVPYLMPASVEAKTTRLFAGDEPWEVEKNAKKAGYDYPDGEMKCTPRCRQRWAKE